MPRPSGPNKFLLMKSCWILDSKRSFPKEAAEVSSIPLSEMLNDFSLLLSEIASQMSFAPLELRKLEFRFNISSLGTRTNP